jgi:hypothetical protein
MEDATDATAILKMPFSLHLSVLSPFCNNEYYDPRNNTHNSINFDFGYGIWHYSTRSSQESAASHTNHYLSKDEKHVDIDSHS